MNYLSRSLVLLGVIGLSACGGGGGGGGSGSGRSESGLFEVSANVTADTCGERISPVTQSFNLGTDGVIDTGIVKVPVAETGDGFTAGFSEANGDCTRDYLAEFSNVTDSGANVRLVSTTTCGAFQCQSEWIGTATRGGVPAEARELSERVRGENCNPNVPTDVGYRASLYECNGNAAILLKGAQRRAYSVVVRKNGPFNDRDPLNPTCGTNRCSPFKTQKQIQLPEFQVNCLGETGFSNNYREVNRISIKYTAKVTNANDINQFEQYCLDSRTTSLN